MCYIGFDVSLVLMILRLFCSEESFKYIDERLDVLTHQCVTELLRQGFKRSAPPHPPLTPSHPSHPHTHHKHPHTLTHITHRDDIVTTHYLHLRYQRTDCALMVTPDSGKGHGSCNHGNYETAFTRRYVGNNDYTIAYRFHRYEREFGFTIPDRPIVVDDIRVRGTAEACSHSPTHLPPAVDPPHSEQVSPVSLPSVRPPT